MRHRHNRPLRVGELLSHLVAHHGPDPKLRPGGLGYAAMLHEDDHEHGDGIRERGHVVTRAHARPLAFDADAHFPCHYTEYGVLCACGASITSADDRCAVMVRCGWQWPAEAVCGP